MSIRLNKNFLHVKGDVLVLEYVFEDVGNLNTMTKNVNNGIVWRAKDNTNNIITKDKTTGIEIHSENPSMCTVTLDPADTSSLEAKQYTYQLRVLDLNSNPVTVAIGTMDLRESFF